MSRQPGRHHHHHGHGRDTAAAALLQNFRPDRLFATAVFVLLGLCLVLGGASRENAVPAAIVEIYALALAPFAVRRLVGAASLRAARLPLAICAAALLIPLAQLIPLPPALWSALPGRELARQAYEAAGLALPWAPVSLTPALTLHAVTALIPAVVVFLSVITLSATERRNALAVVLGGALLGVFVGMLQVGLRTQGLYENVHTGLPIGFFANRNHTALLMVSVLPIAAALIAMARQTREGLAVPVFGGAVILAAIVTLGLLQSRAGILLFLPAVVGSVLIALKSGMIRRSRLRTWIVVAGAIAGVGVLAAVGLSAILLRFETDPGQDLRFAAAPDVWKAAFAHMPFGSGLGSFDAVYRSVERTPLLTPLFFNHAHNDYLELLLESGWLGVAALAGFLLWLVPAAWRAWRIPGPQAGIAQAGTVIVLLVLLHSTVDYPLRTLALSALFALACGLFAAPLAAPPAQPSAPRRSRGERSPASPAPGADE